MSTVSPTSIDIETKKEQPLLFRIIAQLLSLAFHPLFIVSYAFLLLLWADPYAFGEPSFSRFFEDTDKFVLFVRLVLFTFWIPVVAVVLMYALGIVSSITIPDRMERIGPYLLTGTFYLITFLDLKQLSIIPMEFAAFLLGSIIALFTAFFINLFQKISIHAVGMGGGLAMLLVIVTRSYQPAGLLLLLGVLACGAVGTSRYLLSNHTPKEIYGGYVIGFIAQLIALSVFGSDSDFYMQYMDAMIRLGFIVWILFFAFFTIKRYFASRT